jgi:hypothetical protein
MKQMILLLRLQIQRLHQPIRPLHHPQTLPHPQLLPILLLQWEQ